VLTDNPIKPMLAHQFRDYQTKVTYPCLVQPKLDGVRMVWDGEKFYSRKGKPLYPSFTLVKELRRVASGIPLDGELYHKDLSFDEVSAAVRTNRATPDTALIEYHVFDAIDAAKKGQERQFVVCRALSQEGLTKLKIVPTFCALSERDLEQFFRTWKEQGYEGLIYRNPKGFYFHARSDNRTKDLLKLKVWPGDPSFSVVAQIVGVKEGKTGKARGTCGALKVITKDSCFSVGSGLDYPQRDEIWENPQRFIGKSILVEYQEMTKAGVPRFPIFKGFVE